MDRSPDEDAWFAAKTYGYGAGLPIRWQGWAALGLYLLALLGISAVSHGWIRMAGIIVVTALLCIVAAFKTEGGWRWRWGRWLP